MNVTTYRDTNTPTGFRDTQLHILLIEDSETDAYAIKRALKNHMKHPYHIDHAKSIGDAASLLQNRNSINIDLILLDLGLPDTNGGKETFNELEAIKEETPVIILTSLHDHELAIEIINNGAEDYIKKSSLSTDPEALCDAIIFAVHRHLNVEAIKEEAEKEREEKDQLLHYIEGGYSC